MQRISDHANTADTLSAPLVSRRGGAMSVRRSITNSGESLNHRQQNSDEETDDDEMLTSTAVQPLVQSLQDLVDSQRGLLSDRLLDREHRERENSRKQRFDRHSFLVDEAQTYRMKIAEFSGVDDDRSRCMLHFYTSELTKLEDRIEQFN
jgi:hypothetical protein